MKVCSKCNKVKPETAYWKHSTTNDGLCGICKSCRKKNHQAWYQKNKAKVIIVARKWRCRNRERTNENNRKWREKNKERHKLNQRKALCKRFGIEVKDYDELFSKQKGLCAICGKKETMIYQGAPRNLSIDHDHATGRVRGLLCQKCNIMLGGANDNINTLTKAIEYLNFIRS